MEQFIQMMYDRGKIDADKVKSYVPTYLTQEQADKIIGKK